MSLDIIERQRGITERIDYSKIDKYLDKAIYLEEDVIYIDQMELPRNAIQHNSSILIELFCFIAHELQKELEQEAEDRVYLESVTLMQ